MLVTPPLNYEYDARPFRRLCTVLVSLIFIAAGLLLILFFMVATQKEPNYYASTTTGEVVPIEALSAPVVTQEYVLEWAKLVVRTAYNLDFVTHKEQIKNASQYFTSGGWSAFNQALEDSGLLQSVLDKKLYLSTVVNGAAVITNRYVTHGRFTWEVQMPVLITYTSASMKKDQQFYVGMTIQRVPEIEDPRGIAVINFYNRSK